MSIDRIEQIPGKEPKVTTVPAGHDEQLYPRGFWRNFGYAFNDRDKLRIKVVSDDKVEVYHMIEVTKQDEKGITIRDSRGQEVSFQKVTSSTILEKHDINDKDLQTDPFGRKRKVVSFKWRPSKMMVMPDEEASIQQLIREGHYSQDDAANVRDNIIYKRTQEEKQKRALLPPKR